MVKKIINILFILLTLLEIYFLYLYLIAPLVPVIKSFLTGMPTIDISNILHPLKGISINNYSILSLATLIIDALTRLAFFSMLFGITFKLKGFILRKL